MKVLHLDSSILGDHSASRQLSRSVVETFKAANPGAEVVYHDLAAEDRNHFSGASLAAAGTPADARNAAQQQEVEANEATLQEFLESDVVIIGAPVYNFSIPSQLKAWYDRVAVAGRTFRYTENGHEGLLKILFGFIGVTDLEFVFAHGLSYGDEPRAAALSAAQKRIAEELFAAA